MEYKTAFDFWQDLLIQFGSNAKKAAENYLDTITSQERRTGHADPDELAFCKDLYRIISAVK